jgi:hypothetical protein
MAKPGMAKAGVAKARRVMVRRVVFGISFPLCKSLGVHSVVQRVTP